MAFTQMDLTNVFHREGPARPGQEDLIVGHARLGERSLTLETNSLRRADALRKRGPNASRTTAGAARTSADATHGASRARSATWPTYPRRST